MGSFQGEYMSLGFRQSEQRCRFRQCFCSVWSTVGLDQSLHRLNTLSTHLKIDCGVTIITACNVFTRVCHSVHRGRRCIPACITGNMIKHYISRCTGDQSQLVQGQHTSNALWDRSHGTPPGQKSPRQTTAWADTPARQIPLAGQTPQGRHTPRQTPPRIWSMS